MGKKGSWFSAIKRIFVHNPKEKHLNEHENNNPNENKKKIRGQKHGETTKVTKSFIPKFREPSSIEKILGEADEQKLFSRPSTPFETPLLTPRAISSPKATFPKATSPKATSTQVTSDTIRVASPRASSQRVPSPKASSSRDIQSYNSKEVARYKPEPTLRYRHLSATKIQAAYKGYKARRSCRALRGIVRLQVVMRGQNVKRQTENTMKMMQQLVRCQTQLRSHRRREILENQRPTFHQSEAGNQENWDDSTLTKEEIQARIQKRTEAALKRERTLAYAFFRQSGKSIPKSTQASVADIRPGESPWWSWLERQLHVTKDSPASQPKRTYNLTPSRNTPEPKPSPRSPSTYNPPHHHFDNYEATTPTSTRSMAPLRSKHFMPTPPHGRNQVLAQTSSGSAVAATTKHKTPPRQSPGMMKTPKTRTRVPSLSGSETGLKDDDSLMSCPPPYTVPNYMTPTASASAKARPNSNPKERFPGTPGNDSKRRFSFPMTPNNIGSFKWNKGSSKNDDSGSNKQYFNESERDFSVDSAISMPSAAAGRKAFNRFV